MKARLVLVMGFCLVGAVACSKSHKKANSKSEFYSYDIVEAGCPTGKHAFRDKTSFCKTLMDDAQNRNCASQSRMKLAQQSGCLGATGGGSTATGGGTTGGSTPAKATDVQQNGNKYSYNLTVNGCSTGQQVYYSKAELCEGLQNDYQNNDCAHTERVRLWRRYNCENE